jgi:hypothetical protein
MLFVMPADDTYVYPIFSPRHAYCKQVTPHLLFPNSLLAPKQSGAVGVVDWHLYIIQEYADGGSLIQALDGFWFWDRAKRQPNLGAILSIAQDIAAAMAYLHSNNIMHGRYGSMRACKHTCCAAANACNMHWQPCNHSPCAVPPLQQPTPVIHGVKVPKHV